jgi:hypothetical protein
MHATCQPHLIPLPLITFNSNISSSLSNFLYTSIKPLSLGSTALCLALVALLVSGSYTQSLGLLTGAKPVAGQLPAHRTTQYRYPCLQWDSNPLSKLPS